MSVNVFTAAEFMKRQEGQAAECQTIQTDHPVLAAMEALTTCGAAAVVGTPIRLVVETETHQITYDAHVEMVEVDRKIIDQSKLAESNDVDSGEGNPEFIDAPVVDPNTPTDDHQPYQDGEES